jgi:rhodanese-related sulfurtransferase
VADRRWYAPGSLHFADPDSMLRALSPDDEIAVYCSGPSCMASAFAYWFLKNRGYRNVRRYAGGIEQWQAAGLPLEGEQASAEA